MDAKETFVVGGVKICYEFHGGLHRYEVDVASVSTHGPGGTPAFAKAGDMLTFINDTNLAHVPPEELAQLLTNGNPKLTVHQATRNKDQTKQTIQGKDGLHAFKKETTVLGFSMEMRREEDLGQGGGGFGGDGCVEEGDVECSGSGEVGPGDKDNREEEGKGCAMLVVKLTNTSISVVKGRGCQEGCISVNCQGTGCLSNEVVIVTHSGTVTTVPGNQGSFMRAKEKSNIALESIVSQRYLRDLFTGNRLFTSITPERMTIYSYKPSVMEEFRGMPVVLNFTKSQCFLKCCKQEERVTLRVEACDKQQLRLISKQDESAMAFLFYMKGMRSGERKFESALFPGWFINLLNDTVDIAHQQGNEEQLSFYFIIQPQPVA